MPTQIDPVYAVTVLIGLVAWFVRLEANQKSDKREGDIRADRFEKDLDNVRIKHEALDSKVINELSEIKQSLARIEGKLEQ